MFHTLLFSDVCDLFPAKVQIFTRLPALCPPLIAFSEVLFHTLLFSEVCDLFPAKVQIFTRLPALCPPLIAFSGVLFQDSSFLYSTIFVYLRTILLFNLSVLFQRFPVLFQSSIRRETNNKTAYAFLQKY